MKQPIKKQWQLPFDLCRAAKALAIGVGIFAALGLFILLAVNYPMHIILALMSVFVCLAVSIILTLIYHAVGPCK